ncbi:membrane protein [Amycolatopsis deserti]|uniref:Membrane protein n=1 Tax=Amycolatopsis deserti TaxID=185696 RepID=A0ABQ3IUW0_9PSEU|nr:low temperature requirement protein A [Amycolatopsis deserti]GHE93677.1 membrane protein [Amycolatopsis deserti]
MPAPNARVHRDVSPLELFFDLVFVLAIGQLTHHLIEHLTWRGAGETLIALVAVCGVWAFTSFEVTLLDIERAATRAITLLVMGLGLFMNAGIKHAFDSGPWVFVVPMLLALAGPGAYAAATSPAPELRRHFVRVLIWIGASAPFWVAGAVSGPESRIWWWAAGALIDLLGTWTAHPMPGRTTRTERLPFDAKHMLERLRLFLIILLGETVLTLGRVLADHAQDALTPLLALGGFVALVCLWAIYFGRSEQEVVSHAAESADPIRSVHLGINVVYGVVAGLVVFAAGMELVLVHAHDPAAGIAGVLVAVGPLVYLAAQAVYFRAEPGTGWLPRALGAAALGIVAAAAYWLPAFGVVTLLVVVLVVPAAHLVRARAR